MHVGRQRGTGPGESTPWDDLLDFVGLVASPMHLTGWSLGLKDGDVVHTFSRGFSAQVSELYASIPLAPDLPGPATVLTGEDQFFRSRSEAHRRYPAAAGIDDGSVHQAAATLALRAPGTTDAVGYLALHFAGPQEFDEQARRRLRRLAGTVEPALRRAARHGSPARAPAHDS